MTCVFVLFLRRSAPRQAFSSLRSVMSASFSPLLSVRPSNILIIEHLTRPMQHFLSLLFSSLLFSSLLFSSPSTTNTHIHSLSIYFLQKTKKQLIKNDEENKFFAGKENKRKIKFCQKRSFSTVKSEEMIEPFLALSTHLKLLSSTFVCAPKSKIHHRTNSIPTRMTGKFTSCDLFPLLLVALLSGGTS